MKFGKCDPENLAGQIWRTTNPFRVLNKLSLPILLGALFIIVATLIAYWPVFSAGFIWDDDAYVTNNPLLTAPDGMSRIWFSAHSQSQYFPLVFTTLRLEYALWDFNPLGYHVVNVGLHIVNALLIWALLRRLALPGAWLAAAIFALHPVQVESVAWITELKNTESILFYLLALFAWLNFCGGKGHWYYMLALVLHAFGLFAKTTACTLPAVLLLVLWLKQMPINRWRIAQVLPFLALGLGMGLVSVWWEAHLGNTVPRYHLVGGLLDRLLVASHAIWFYAGKLFWPANLTFSYPHWEINSREWRQYVWLIACALTAAGLWLGRARLGRGPAAAVIFFVAVLSPMLGFVPLYTFWFSYVADHYQYLACLGMIALAAGVATRLVDIWPATRRLSLALAAMLLLSLTILTRQQCGIYLNLETLWVDTLKKNPDSWMAHTNLGRIEAARGMFAEAEAHYLAALKINPEEENIYYNYGNLLARTGRLDEAITRYRQSLQIMPAKPETYNNLGYIFIKQHRVEEAIAQFKLAIFYNPDYADACYNLGNALASEHKTADAIRYFQQAVRLNPDSELYRKQLREFATPTN